MTILLNNIAISLNDGSQVFGPVGVPNPVSTIRIALKRQTPLTPLFWPDVNTQISFSVDVSVDSGNTFQFLCGFTSSGGIVLQRDGTASPLTQLVCNLPARVAPFTRQMIGTLIVTGGPLVSELTVEVL